MAPGRKVNLGGKEAKKRAKGCRRSGRIRSVIRAHSHICLYRFLSLRPPQELISLLMKRPPSTRDGDDFLTGERGLFFCPNRNWRHRFDIRSFAPFVLPRIGVGKEGPGSTMRLSCGRGGSHLYISQFGPRRNQDASLQRCYAA